MRKNIFEGEKRDRASKGLALLLSAVLAAVLIPAIGLAEDRVIKMSTTTSTQASGLLDVLIPAFTKDTGIEVKVFAKGTGSAIRDGMDGNVDVIFVHAKNREEQFLAEGYGTERYAVMHNDFVIIGPLEDPAGIRGMKDAPAALTRIGKTQSKFVSRGDDSGTHTKEQLLWAATGLPLEEKRTLGVQGDKEQGVTFRYPKDASQWYLSIGQGMGKTIIYADERRAYTLSDRGTYIKYKFGRKETLDLEILCEGDARLNNPYGVIPVSPGKHPHVKYDLARQFAMWLVSERGQALIAGYRILGHQVFYPDALPSAN